MGAASISQAIAPTKGGVTSEAITSVRTVRRSGMSVRATSQPNGAATRQQIALTENGDDRVVISGSTKRRIGEQGDEVAERRLARPCRDRL